MAVIRVAVFAGENRALNPKLLPDTVGVLSRNQKPGRGDLRPWKTPATVATVPAGRKTIYRMGRDVASDSNYWLSWSSKVHSVRGFDVEDTTERTYYTGDGVPKVTDNIMALSSAPYPTTFRPLGLPAPSSAPTASVDAGAWEGTNETAFYVYTYVNDWGWESAPSPPSLAVEKPSDATVTVTGFSAPPAGNYGINRIRVYRTYTGQSSAEFFFMAEAPLGTTSVVDTNASPGEVLPTTTWLMPPADLSFLTALWNGMLAGISGNSVRFCHPYTPYAWPIEYDVVPPDSKPVALGVFGQTLLVLTTSRPLLVAGSGPDAMDQQLLDIPQACVAPQSVASMGAGVAWASNDGLCWYGSGGAKIITAGLMTRDDWQALNPSSIVGCMYEGLYFGSYDDGSGRKGFFIDPMNPSGIFFTDVGYETMYFDELQDQLYVLNANNVQRWDSGTPMTARFKSKVFRLPRPAAFACGEVVSETYPVQFKLYADGALRYSHTVTSRNPFRLPSGFMASDWQVELETATDVVYAAIAGSMTELADT